MCVVREWDYLHNVHCNNMYEWDNTVCVCVCGINMHSHVLGRKGLKPPSLVCLPTSFPYSALLLLPLPLIIAKARTTKQSLPSSGKNK